MRPKSFVPVVLLAIAICGLATSRAQETKNATSRETPSERLKLMQGNWEVTAIFEPSLSDDGHFPKEIVFAKEGAKITIKGNELICDGHTIATMANDMSLAAQRAEKGFEAFDLAMLTLPTGKGILCSYFVSSREPNVMEFAYTHKTSCHRGSGHIIRLSRSPK